MISVEIPVTHGTYIKELMSSLMAQTFQDFEVIVVIPEEQKHLLEGYDAKLVLKKTGLLDARCVAHSTASGENALILDETRILNRNTLLKLSQMRNKMVIIREKESIGGIWGKLAELDKEITWRNRTRMEVPYVLPRYFSSELLTQSFNNLKNELAEVWTKIIHPDHWLIYSEARSLSSDVSHIEEKLITHYSEEGLFPVMKKYYKYGKSEKWIMDTKYGKRISSTSRIRGSRNIKEMVPLLILYSIRGIPFLMGKHT